MKDKYYYLVGAVLLLSFLLPLGYLIGQGAYQEAALSEAPEGVYFTLGGLELWNLSPGNYSFDVVLENPYSYPVVLSWVSESELPEYVTYSCSLSDGSLIEADSNVTSKVDVVVSPNPYNMTWFFKLYGKGVTP